MTQPSRDHVSQVYLGLLDGGPTSDWLRRRIDWMTGEAKGPRVLDVGCSEGILEVLLGRRGVEVIGVDIDPDALDFARELLAKEPDEVRQRVELIHGDFLEAGQTDGLFDTVVMGEVIEYVDDPGAMLDRVLEHLRPGGRVVVTTPFGVHPIEGGRRTFFLTDVIDLFRPRLGLERLDVEDNGIRFVGRLWEDSQLSWDRLDAEAVLSVTDAALMASLKELYGMLAMRESRVERLQRRLQERVEVDRDARDTADTSRGEIKKLEFRVKLDRMALAQLKNQVNARTRDLKARTREVRDRTRELQTTRRQLHTTLASTSFRVGVAMVSAIRQTANAVETAIRSPADIPFQAQTAGGGCNFGGTSRTEFGRFRSITEPCNRTIYRPRSTLCRHHQFHRLSGPARAGCWFSPSNGSGHPRHVYRVRSSPRGGPGTGVAQELARSTGEEATGMPVRRVGLEGKQRRVARPHRGLRGPGGQPAA